MNPTTLALFLASLVAQYQQQQRVITIVGSHAGQNLTGKVVTCVGMKCPKKSDKLAHQEVRTDMEDSTCKHCDQPIVREKPGSGWKHFPSLDEECYPIPSAEPKRDSSGHVIPITTKQAPPQR